MAAVFALIVALAAGCGGSNDGATAEASKEGPAEPRLVAGGHYITAPDCRELARYYAKLLGEPVQANPRPMPKRFSECSLRGKKGLTVIYLDATTPVRKRYLKRIHGSEAGAQKPSQTLQPVAGLGQAREGEPGGYWLPIMDSLYVYRADGWMTLLNGLESIPDKQRRSLAEALARRTFELTAG
jgi:hypothetical protein